MSQGIHHVTLITARAQANVDFYAGFLGLRLVKRTAGFEDAAQLHLFYGDTAGSPGSLVTFLVWEAGAAGRPGRGRFSGVSLAIPIASIGFWLTRAMAAGVKLLGPTREFGEPVLSVTDPDGFALRLVGSDALDATAPLADDAVPAGHAIRRIRGVTLFSDRPTETQDFLAGRFGYREVTREQGLVRLASRSDDTVDVRSASGFWPGVPGPGTIDHVAFRASDAGAIGRARAAMRKEGREVSPVKDRRYFTSIYVREPGGALCELASDGPGMTLDEDIDRLGEALFIPPDVPDEVRLRLPETAMPVQQREMRADLPFVHRLRRPPDADGSIMVLLHGTGGEETDLMPLAQRIAPRATLLGFRGRSLEEGAPRWFRRLSAARFDQNQIVGEAAAFAAMLPDALARYGLDPERTVVLGYSNGANFAAATMLLHPGVTRAAALLRPMLVLEAPPAADLEGTRLLSVTGSSDPYGSYAPALHEALLRAGATLEHRELPAGHQLTAQDVTVVREWLEAGGARRS